jgi:cholesterol transport system auxiliary component
MRPLPAAALAVAALSLAACISVLPKSKPAQLYRFGGADAGASAAPAAPAAIARGASNFTAEAATDRILTLDGHSAAYIEGARWVAPAPVLFDEALSRAFQAPGAPPLADRGLPNRAPVALSIDVQAFEARYDHGPDAAPEVIVQVKAELNRTSDRTLVDSHLFSSAQRASDNRVGAIVQAYDAAVHDALGQLVTWTKDKAR